MLPSHEAKAQGELSAIPPDRAQRKAASEHIPTLSCAPVDGEQRLSKQELVRQQIAQETFPNEAEGLVPSPGAAALRARGAGQRCTARGPAPRVEWQRHAGRSRARPEVSFLSSQPLTLLWAGEQGWCSVSGRQRWGARRGSAAWCGTADRGQSQHCLLVGLGVFAQGGCCG